MDDKINESRRVSNIIDFCHLATPIISMSLTSVPVTWTIPVMRTISAMGRCNFDASVVYSHHSPLRQPSPEPSDSGVSLMLSTLHTRHPVSRHETSPNVAHYFLFHYSVCSYLVSIAKCEYYFYYEEDDFSSVWCCIMKNSFCRSISFRNCSSVGKYSLYFVANICSFPFNIEYLAISASVSEQSTMPMVGLSPSVRFNSSYIRTYMSICPTSWCVIFPTLRSIST